MELLKYFSRVGPKIIMDVPKINWMIVGSNAKKLPTVKKLVESINHAILKNFKVIDIRRVHTSYLFTSLDLYFYN